MVDSGLTTTELLDIASKRSAAVAAADASSAGTPNRIEHLQGGKLPIYAAGYLQTAPDPAIGRFYLYDAANNFQGTCSGTVVARNMIVTAAHCVVGNASWVFEPQQFGTQKPYGSYQVTHYFAQPNWPTGGVSTDWAFLLFNSPVNGRFIGDVTGYFAIMSDAPGGNKYSVGYPGEGWFEKNCGADSCSPYSCSSPITSQGYVKYLTDTTVAYGGRWSQGIGCFMTGGASGGGMFQQVANQRFQPLPTGRGSPFGGLDQ